MAVALRSLLFLFVLLAAVAPASVASVSLPDIARQSDLIVIADVTSLDTVQGMKVAMAEVRHGYKGNPLTVRFLAQPTWKCDTSTAVVGERVLLFLAKGSRYPADSRQARLGKSGVYMLSHSGRGRVVLRQSAAGWIAGVDRYDRSQPWQLNVNLVLPERVPVVQTGSNTGTITLEKIVAAALPAPRQNR
jgi:hypothetical protein